MERARVGDICEQLAAFWDGKAADLRAQQQELNELSDDERYVILLGIELCEQMGSYWRNDGRTELERQAAPAAAQ